MSVLAVGLALLAGAAQAQRPEFPAVPTTECLARGGGMDCLWLSSDACQTPAGDLDANDIRFCIHSEFLLWEAELDRLHARLLAEAEALSHDGRADIERGEADAWLAAFRDWREARCRVEARRDRPHGGWSMQIGLCRAQLTAREVVDLAATLRE